MGGPSRPPGGDVPAAGDARGAPAAGQVLTAVIAGSLARGGRARVPRAEPLADQAAQEHLAAGRAVADDVARDHLLLGGERPFGAGPAMDPPPGRPLPP